MAVRAIDIVNGTVGEEVVVEERRCACGCERPTKSVWFPGHDALMHAQPRCIHCDEKRIPATRDFGLFCTSRCAAKWAAINAPTERDLVWSVPAQRWFRREAQEAETVSAS